MRRILIIEKSPTFRLGIKTWINSNFPEFRISESCDKIEVKRIVRKFRVDLVIVDFDWLNINNVADLERLSVEFNHVNILIFAQTMEVKIYQKYFRDNLKGYIYKSVELTELSLAIRSILDGSYSFSRELASIDPCTISNVKKVKEKKIKGLSKRELEVFSYLRNGADVVEISNFLNVSVSTVCTYKSRLLKKLKINTILELVRLRSTL